MTRKWGFVFLTLLIFSACSSPAQNLTSPESPSFTETATPVSTSTLTPTHRFSTNTPTLTPSTTPTLDIASIVSLTPAPPENCPQLASIPLPDLSVDPDNYSFSFSPKEESVLQYLNQGGNPSNIIAIIRQKWGNQDIYATREAIQDLTGDGIPELLIIPSELIIFGCLDNKYEILMTQINEAASMNPIGLQLIGIQDMNLNGMPEIVLASFGCGGMGAGQCLDVNIYEWDGDQFISLFPIRDGYRAVASMIGGRMSEYLPDAKLRDIDNNGTLELILTGDIPSRWYSDYYWNEPWRDKSDTYGWNGRNFVPIGTEFSLPQYRYQAVQDGDRALLKSEYDQALAFYQAAIFDDSLLGWSEAHKARSKELPNYDWDPDYYLTPTPVLPPDDPEEYPNLAAYARYRIMLLHILQENFPEAQIVYETLQEKFPEGSDGYGFALVAKAFWDQYQLSKNMKESCMKAISIINEQKSLLKFLGADHHNSWQDIIYQPKDVCPFE